MFEKILFPVDSSESSEKTIPYCIDLATKHKAIVLLLSTYTPPKEDDENAADIEANRKKTEKVLEQAGQTMHDKGIEVYTLSKEGKPGPVILEVAEAEKCNLVIMGTRGLGSVAGFIQGSVSHYVVHNNKTCPVLLIY